MFQKAIKCLGDTVFNIAFIGVNMCNNLEQLIRDNYASNDLVGMAISEIRKLRAAIEKMRCAGCKYEFQAAFDEAKMLIPSNHETERTAK